jgi:hypothetical protein
MIGEAARDCAASRQRMLGFAMHDVFEKFMERRSGKRGVALYARPAQVKSENS